MMLSLTRRLTFGPAVCSRVSAALWSSSAATPEERFKVAVANLDKLSEEPSNDVKAQVVRVVQTGHSGQMQHVQARRF
ncbi:hypothetical protein MRX96_004402 [Rhipicephalus microplus]